jgi:hypothetical protein
MNKVVTKKSKIRRPYTPENIGGGCMTGRVATEAEAKKVSSFITQYKANKKPFSTSKPKS